MAGGFHDIAINSVLLFRSVTETGGRSRNQRLTIRLDLGLRQRLGVWQCQLIWSLWILRFSLPPSLQL